MPSESIILLSTSSIRSDIKKNHLHSCTSCKPLVSCYGYHIECGTRKHTTCNITCDKREREMNKIIYRSRNSLSQKNGCDTEYEISHGTHIECEESYDTRHIEHELSHACMHADNKLDHETCSLDSMARSWQTFEQQWLRLFGCLLFLVVVLSRVSTASAEVFLNQWAVEIHGGEKVAEKVALRHGFRNLGQIGALENFYLFEHKRVEKRSPAPSRRHYHRLRTHHRVRWTEQQRVRRRVKRDGVPAEQQQQLIAVDEGAWSPELNDPFWYKMWYLHGGREMEAMKTSRGGGADTTGGAYNMNVIGAWRRGYTGRGVVVTILDDGIEYNHTDLITNYDPRASYDINEGDLDPLPRYDQADENKHGTRCAGEVAAVANNSKCAVGVAFQARIGGVRMLDGDVTDTVEALALSLNPQHIDIYSASWGPEDNGKVVDGPDRLAVEAFNHGILHGRGGKGSIYIWASGNGGSQSDSCSCDGYTNSIYTLSVSSVSESGVKPWYLEECSSTLATTYSSGEYRDRKIMTTDLRNRCTDNHTGTSASAPLAAGICALTLEANGNLTWRDMQHLVILTSRTQPLRDAQWVTNAVGRQVSHRYGYGLMDAEAMVLAAERWTNVPEQHICISEKSKPSSALSGEGGWFEIAIDGCMDTDNAIKYLEHVQVILSLEYSRRGDLQIHLHSPSGTRSTLLPARRNDYHKGLFKSWSFLSVFYWGESPVGTWKIHLENVGFELNTGTLEQWQIILYGTSEPPVNLRDIPPSPSLSPEALQQLFIPQEPLVSLTTPNPETSPSGETLQPKDPLIIPASNETSESEAETDTDGISRNHTAGKPGSAKNRTLEGFTVPIISIPKFTTKSPDAGGEEEVGPPVVVQTEGCHEQCTEDGCTGVTARDCLNCVHARNPSTGECVSECPIGTYYQPITKQCETCVSPCATCSLVEMDMNVQVVSCVTCSTNHYLLSLGVLTVCTDLCPQRYYNDVASGWCMECMSECIDCSGSADNCVECSEGFELISSTCLHSCLHNEYRDLLGRCRPCDSSCGACTGARALDCSACASGLYWQEGLCVLNCTDGYYSDISGASTSVAAELQAGHGHRCHMCHPACSTCYGATDVECHSCYHPFRLVGHSCLEGCPAGEYEDSEGLCHMCHRDCERCTGSHDFECLTCPSPLYHFEGRCIERCYDGLYYVEVDHLTGHVTRRCERCDSTCETCEGGSPKNCITCAADRLFNYGECTTNCSIGEFEEDRRCVRCHDSCLACLGQNADQCVACHEDLHLFNGWCLSDCPTGFYPLEGLCLPCRQHCRICTDDSSCGHCDDGYAAVSGNCISFSQLCGSGQYYNHTQMSCQPCHSTCATCNAGATDACLICPSNFVPAPIGTGPSNQPSTHRCLKCCDSNVLTSGESLECCQCYQDTCIEVVLPSAPPVSISTISHSSSTALIVTTPLSASTNYSTPFSSSSHSAVTPLVTSESVATASSTKTEDLVTRQPSVTSSTMTSHHHGDEVSSFSPNGVVNATIDSSRSPPSLPDTSTIPTSSSSTQVIDKHDMFFGAPVWLVATVIVLCLSAAFAFMFVVAFCLVQARSGNKLCWAKHRYNSVPLFYLQQRNGTNGNTASNANYYHQTSTGKSPGVSSSLPEGKHVQNGRHDIELTSVRV